MIRDLLTSSAFIDLGHPINWSNRLNHGLVCCLQPIPNAYRWGSLTVGDLCRKSNWTMTGLTGTAWVDGQVGGFGAIRFDNSTTHGLTLATSINSNTDPRPISAVFCFRANSTSTATYCLFDNNNSTSPVCLVVLRRVSGSTYKQSLYSNAYVDSSNFTLNTTKYFTYGYTWDASNNVAFYLNGAANGTTTKTVSGGTTAGAEIGMLSASGNAGFLLNGDLTLARFYNRILSAAEMSALAVEIQAGCPTLLNRIPIPGMTMPQSSTFIDNTTPYLSHILACDRHEGLPC